MRSAGLGVSHAPRPVEDWIEVPVPQIVSEEAFAQVQAKLDTNQQGAARNTRHEYLLRALVSCGACRLSCTARQSAAGYCYYLCHGRTDPLRAEPSGILATCVLYGGRPGAAQAPHAYRDPHQGRTSALPSFAPSSSERRACGALSRSSNIVTSECSVPSSTSGSTASSNAARRCR
jgi:hypothetical protein